jgi:hypothetical protein
MLHAHYRRRIIQPSGDPESRKLAAQGTALGDILFLFETVLDAWLHELNSSRPLNFSVRRALFVASKRVAT